jgi:hypothetical protein
LIDRKGIISFNTQITYGRAAELSPYQLRATRMSGGFLAFPADISRIGSLKSAR